MPNPKTKLLLSNVIMGFVIFWGILIIILTWVSDKKGGMELIPVLIFLLSGSMLLFSWYKIAWGKNYKVFFSFAEAIGCRINFNLRNPFKEITIRYKERTIIFNREFETGGYSLAIGNLKKVGPFLWSKRLFPDSQLGKYFFNLTYFGISIRTLPDSLEKTRLLLNDLCHKANLVENEEMETVLRYRN